MEERAEEKVLEQSAPGKLDITVLLHDMVRGLRKYWILAVVLPLVLGIFGGVRSAVSYVPMYRSEASFTVKTQESSDENYYYSFYYDKSTAEQMARTFPYLLDSDVLMGRVKEQLGVSYINGSVTATAVANSNLFTMTVTSRSPSDAKAILDAVIANYPDAAAYVLGKIQLQMIDAPVEPSQPYNQRQWMSAAAKYAMLGLALALGLVVLYALTRNTIRQEQEIGSKLELQCLGVVPQVVFKKRSGKQDTSLSIHNDKTGYTFQEEFRSLALRVQHEAGAKVMGVIATLDNEGAATVARNLALALAEPGKQVLLLDGSFNKSPKSVMSEETLEQYLSGSAVFEQVLCRDKGDHIWLANCGGTMKEADIGRNLENLQRFFREARERMDYIIVTLPPSRRLEKGSYCAELCKSFLYVIRQDTAKIPQIMDGIEDLSRFRGRLLGCVLSGAQRGLTGYGYYEYGYGYGYRKYGHYGRYGRYGHYGHYGYGYGEKDAQ